MNMSKFHHQSFLLLTALTLPFLCLRVTAEDSPQILYDRGLDLLNDYNGSRATRLEGWALLEKAAEAGHLKAKIIIAEFNTGLVAINQPPEDPFSQSPTNPPLLKPNLARALKYFRDGVQSGDAESMVNLALLYSSGIGEPRDESETPHRLLLGAARKGNTDAMLHLSNRYLYGYGEKVDSLEAAQWRYFAWQWNPSDSFLFLDDQGNPKIQSNVALTELADTLSLMYKASDLRNTSAISTLKTKYAEAGKANAPELKEILNGARRNLSGARPKFSDSVPASSGTVTNAPQSGKTK
jgi:TPR repeat protein